MHLVLADIEKEPLERVAAELATHRVRVLPVRTDVTDRDAVFALADTAYREMGTVDVLCSNAGVGSFPPIAYATGADWDWVLSVNIGGMVNCLLAFLPRMKDPDADAHVVLTASIAGLAPMNMTIYSTTKYAIVATPASTATVLLTVPPCHSSTAISAPIAGPTTTQKDGRYEARFTIEPAQMPMSITVIVMMLIGCAGSRNRNEANAHTPPMNTEPAADAIASSSR